MSADQITAIATLIGSMSAAFVSIVIALRQSVVRQEVQAVHAEVRTSNGHTLGELAEAAEGRRVDDDA